MLKFMFWEMQKVKIVVVKVISKKDVGVLKLIK